MDLSKKVPPKDKAKLDELSDIEGTPVLKMLERAVMDSVCKGICMNEGCSYTTDVEPDQTGGYCEVCRTTSVKSCLALAGII
jgi:hypothetical protein